MSPDPTVFVVDDDDAIRDSLRWLLESARLPVETFASASEFLTAFDAARPGCLVLDVRMPEMSGLELQERLAARGGSLPIIVLTAHADVPMAVRAMKNGAADFLVKPFRSQELLERIHAALRKDTEARAEAQRRAAILARLATLTAREREVMDLVVAGRSNKAIAAQLEVSTKTVEAHRTRIMEKMEADSLADLVRMAVSVGTVAPEPPPPRRGRGSRPAPPPG